MQDSATKQQWTLKNDHNFYKNMTYTRHMTKLGHHTYEASVMG